MRWSGARSGITLGLVAMAMSVSVVTAAAAGADAAGASRSVFVLPVQGTIDQSMLYVFRRAFREIERTKPSAVILDLDTPGGRLAETREILQWLRSLRSETPVYAYVNPDAYSAGAILCLGTQGIFMSPGANIGDALPILINPMSGNVQAVPDDIKEKMISPTRALVRGLAQENGYNVEVAEAMVDPDIELTIGPVSCPAGKLLTLTAQEATALVPPENTPVLATAVVGSIEALLPLVGLAGARVRRFEEVGAERLARWITGLGPMLFGLAILALVIEFKTPGFGVFGITGIVLLAIYFFGHYVAGLAGYEEMLVVLVGIILLGLEIFVTPGFGVMGILGIAMVALGSILALIPALPRPPVALPGLDAISLDAYLLGALWRTCLTAVVVILGGWFLGRILPRTPLYRGLVLEAAVGNERGVVAGAGRYDGYVGRTGTARTPLRPAGTAEFGDERLDVVTSGDMIDPGSAVRIVHVEGTRIVVETA